MVQRNHVCTDTVLLCKAVQRRRDQIRRDFQQLHGSLPEGFSWDKYVPIVDHFIQGKYDPRFDS